MGFREWEFVEAYAANRHSSMVASAEASAVGRAVTAFVKAKLTKKEPEYSFAGTMELSRQKLEMFRGDTRDRDWPKDATRLSTHLSRAATSLAAMGIECLLRQDRRKQGGTQFDVVLKWREGHAFE